MKPSAVSYRTSPRDIAFLNGRSINPASVNGPTPNGSLARFLADQSKLVHALAELEREREQRVQMPMEEIVVNLSEFGAEEVEPEQTVACQMSTIHLNIKDFSAPEAASQMQASNH